MSAENRIIVRRVFEEVWNNRNLGVVNELFASNYIHHDSNSPEVRGAEGYARLVDHYLAAFPDLRCSIDDLVAEGDRVVARWTATGIHRGELMGIAPTQRQAIVTGTVIYLISAEKIVESWSHWDALGLLQQLGVVPLTLAKGRAA